MVIESVLVIDDEPDILTITRMSLQLVGKLEVWTASSGPEGIALAAERQPDLILLDLMMPEMDGAETLAHLRARPATAAIPVVFLTAKLGDDAKLESLGCLGLLSKPFDPMQLPSQLAALTGASLTRQPTC